MPLFPLLLLTTPTATADGDIGALSGVSASDEGQAVSFTCSWTDSGDPIHWTWDLGDGTSASSTSTNTSNTVSHTYADDGSYTVTCSASSDDESDSETHGITVSNVAPTLTLAPGATAAEGERYQVEVQLEDPGVLDVHTWTATLPAGAAFDSGSLFVDWTPTYDQEGVHTLSLAVDDGDGGTDSHTWEVSVSVRDDDGDGLPDTWEEEHGLDSEDPSDATADPDGDGRDNAQEQAEGTDPLTYEGPGVPSPVSPVDGEAWTEEGLVLTADNAEAPLEQPLEYRFELYADEALTELVLGLGEVSEGLGGQTAADVELALEEDAPYWWRVRASDAYVDGDWSELAHFVRDLYDAPDSGWPDSGTGTQDSADTADPADTEAPQDTGAPDTATGDSGALDGEAAAVPDDFCGCSGTGAPGGALAWWSALIGLALVRRRTRV